MIQKLPHQKSPCQAVIAFQGRSVTGAPGLIYYACIKNKGHLGKHRVDGPIEFDGVNGLKVVMERSIEWEERP